MAVVTSTAREQIARLLGEIGAGSFSARRTSATADDEWLAEDEPPVDDPDAYLEGDLLDSSVTVGWTAHDASVR